MCAYCVAAHKHWRADELLVMKNVTVAGICRHRIGRCVGCVGGRLGHLAVALVPEREAAVVLDAEGLERRVVHVLVHVVAFVDDALLLHGQVEAVAELVLEVGQAQRLHAIHQYVLALRTERHVHLNGLHGRVREVTDRLAATTTKKRNKKKTLLIIFNNLS